MGLWVKNKVLPPLVSPFTSFGMKLSNQKNNGFRKKYRLSGTS